MALRRTPSESGLKVWKSFSVCVCLYVCVSSGNRRPIQALVPDRKAVSVCGSSVEVKIDRLLSLVNEAELGPGPRILQSHATSSWVVTYCLAILRCGSDCAPDNSRRWRKVVFVWVQELLSWLSFLPKQNCRRQDLNSRPSDMKAIILSTPPLTWKNGILFQKLFWKML